MNVSGKLNRAGLDALSACVDDMIGRHVVPGMAVTLLNDSDSWTAWRGVKDLTTGEPVGADTLFDLASLTKVIATLTGVARLVEAGRIHWQDPVARYVPGCTGNATVLECVTHCSGYRAGRIDYRYMDRAQLIKAVLEHPQDPALRGRVVYSDVNYILLGWLVENMAPERDLAAYVHQEILAPLGMRDTGYCPQDAARCCAYERTVDDGLIRGRVHDGKAFRLGGVSGHAGLFSTIGDIRLFLRAYLARDPILFGPDLFDALQTFRVAGDTQIRTLGWLYRRPDLPFAPEAGPHTIYHSGFTGCYLFIDYDAHLALGILSNRIHPDRTNMKIFDELSTIQHLAYQAVEEE